MGLGSATRESPLNIKHKIYNSLLGKQRVPAIRATTFPSLANKCKLFQLNRPRFVTGLHHGTQAMSFPHQGFCSGAIQAALLDCVRR